MKQALKATAAVIGIVAAVVLTTGLYIFIVSALLLMPC